MIIRGVREALDMGKEGAQLELTRERFDRLSHSIGTTGSALIGDLHRATRLMMDDSVALAAATDFMSLGLAKTHDEAVRLTRISAALGMNMNQLVLTLTNKTTMRFDALGVAVDGFEDKVKKLEAAGYGVDEAFKLAFMQQAEEQIARVGDVADTNAGKIARFEAVSTNLANAIKLRLAPAVAGLYDELFRLIATSEQLLDATGKDEKAIASSADSYEAYIKELRKGLPEMGLWIDSQGRLIRVHRGAKGATIELIDAFYAMSDAAFERSRAGQFYIDVVEKGIFAEQRAKDAVNDVQYAMEAAARRYFEGTGLLEELREAYGATGARVDYFRRQLEKANKEAQQERISHLLDILDRDVGSPIAALMEDLKWLTAGGGRINAAFETLKENISEAVLAGEVTPAQADAWLRELFIAQADLQSELNMVDASTAAQNISQTLGISLEDAKAILAGTDGIEAVLARLAATEHQINIQFNYIGEVPWNWSG